MSFSHDIAGGKGDLVANSVQSPNFVRGSAGWQVAKNGTAEFNNAVIRQGEIVSGVTLIYSGTPAGPPAGNLVLSIAAAGGTDAYGNTYLPGLTQYVNDSRGEFAQLNGAIMIFGNNTYPTVAAGAGGINLQADGSLLFHVDQTGGSFQLNQGNGNIQVSRGSRLVASHSDSTAETWQTVTALPAGWTPANAGVRYRLMPDASVRIQVSASIGSTAASGAVTVFTLPTGYIPLNQFRGCAPGIYTSVSAASGAQLSTRFTVTPAGLVQFLAFPGGSSSTGVTEVDGQWDVPLD